MNQNVIPCNVIAQRTCCGTCKYHKPRNGDFECTNENSDFYADYTDYNHHCEEYEEDKRDGKQNKR